LYLIIGNLNEEKEMSNNKKVTVLDNKNPTK
jgi:hypothetical protein